MARNSLKIVSTRDGDASGNEGSSGLPEQVTVSSSRNSKGQFAKGTSGNPLGRPKGSRNAITLLKQEIEHSLREQAAPNMGAVLDKALELALDGNITMLKFLLETHLSKTGVDKAEEQHNDITFVLGTTKGQGSNKIIDVTPATDDD